MCKTLNWGFHVRQLNPAQLPNLDFYTHHIAPLLVSSVYCAIYHPRHSTLIK